MLKRIIGSMVVKGEKYKERKAAGTTMGRKKPGIRYQLDSGDLRNLAWDEIKVILDSKARNVNI